MAKFCTQCGTPSDDDDAQFCQSCGSRLPASKMQQVAGQPADASYPSQALPLAKIAKFTAMGVASLSLLGGGVWFVTKAPSTPDSSALTMLLNADVKSTEQRVCIANFPYDKEPAFINNYDASTKNWLDLLVRGGIYNAPETQVTSSGWFRQVQYKYTHTPIGLKAVRNGKLCFADGIVIEKVEYSEQKKINEKTFVEANYTYHYANPAAWVNEPEAKAIDPQHFGQSSFVNSATLSLEDGKWKLMSGQVASNTGFGSLGQAGSSAGSGRASPSSEFFGWFSNLFSGMGGNPLIGKWSLDSEKMGMGSINIGQQFEFTADEMRSGSSIQKVTYEVRGNEVLVTDASGRSATAFTIIDHDHIALETGMGKLTLRRVN